MTPQPSEQPRTAAGRTWLANREKYELWHPIDGRRAETVEAILAIEAEAAAPDPVASPPEAVRLLRELVDRWFLYSDDLPKADVMDRLARLDAFHASADEARRYLASATEGETAE